MKQKKKLSRSDFRSNFELEVARQLNDLGVYWEYEEYVIDWMRPIQSGFCIQCKTETVYQLCQYTPDFYLPELEFYIEAKGRWQGTNRTMHRVIKSASPQHDIRFVFQYDNWLTDKRLDTYTSWCKKHGILASVGIVPTSWVNE